MSLEFKISNSNDPSFWIERELIRKINLVSAWPGNRDCAACLHPFTSGIGAVVSMPVMCTYEVKNYRTCWPIHLGCQQEFHRNDVDWDVRGNPHIPWVTRKPNWHYFMLLVEGVFPDFDAAFAFSMKYNTTMLSALYESLGL